nr:hypothetical protein [Clostridium bornimense]
MISKETYLEIKTWIYRNARNIELSLWKYHFENGTKEDVLSALSVYQNEDGGFGNALEPDSWNPNSSPYTTLYAINILKSINYFDLTHPIYKGITKYLFSEKDFEEYGWRFSIHSNDHYPHAPWMNFNEETNITESIGVTAELSAFILEYIDNNTDLYQKIINLIHKLFYKLTSDNNLGEMGIGGFIVLFNTIKKLKMRDFDYTCIEKKLNYLVKNSIEYDISKWIFYGVRPSRYIRTPNSIYYEENKEILRKELNYIIETKPKDDVWGITWTWFENNEKYPKEFTLSENWWKAYKAIENLSLLKNFDKLEL